MTPLGTRKSFSWALHMTRRYLSQWLNFSSGTKKLSKLLHWKSKFFAPNSLNRSWRFQKCILFDCILHTAMSVASRKGQYFTFCFIKVTHSEKLSYRQMTSNFSILFDQLWSPDYTKKVLKVDSDRYNVKIRFENLWKWADPCGTKVQIYIISSWAFYLVMNPWSNG